MSDELTTEIVQLIATSRGSVGNSAVSRPSIPRTQASVVHVEGLAPMFLKNAIRSHLHFSQLNSWISMQSGRLPDGVSCTYRIHLSAGELSRRDDEVTEHTFPVCRMDRQSVLVVSVKYVKAEQMPVPVGLCLTLGVLPIDQWLMPSPLESPTDDGPLIASSEAVTISSLKHKPLPPASPPSPDGPSPKFSAIAGPNDERPARRALSTHMSTRTENRQDSKEIELLASRLQVIQSDRGRQRSKTRGSIFNKITGLPLHSSPAPVSRQRNFQTLFNPQDTVVKVFVITYDMSDMPPSSQTFIRQRTFLGNDDDSKVDKHLVNLIHFRLATDRRCRLYLHTDIRMLFSQNNTLDVLNLELEGHVGHDSARYRLIAETELPLHPRYSPKK
uniref:Chromosome_seg domain-containing protein n=1 Tax=Angiostrongylus cantonensis TaxID=6313 RepID=A0A0K0CTN8_ANGCA